MEFDNKRSVLYLTYDGLTDPLGQSQILPYLCGLSEAGYKITIISFEKKDRFHEKYNLIKNLCNAHNLNWRPLKYHKAPSVLSTIYDLLKLRIAVSFFLKRNNCDILHCRSYPTSLIGLWAKRKFGVKFIFDMRGFWADERVEGGLWSLKNPLTFLIYKFFKKKEVTFLKECDSVVSLTTAAKKYLVSEFNIPEQKIIVIPCSVDLDLFDPAKISSVEKSNLQKKLGLASDDYVLLYLGSLGTWYMYNEMVEFYEVFKKRNPKAKFLFLTPDQDKVQRRDDFIVATVNRSEVPLYCSIAHAAIFFIKPSFSKMASSATKLAEVMAMRLEVVTNPGWGDIDEFNKQGLSILLHKEGSFIELGNTTPLAIDNNRNYILNEMSLKGAISRYLSVYNTLCSNN